MLRVKYVLVTRSVTVSGFKTEHGQAKAIANSTATRRGKSEAHACKVGPLILNYRRQGMGYHAIADLLNQGNVSPPRGGRWYSMTVKRVAERILEG